MKHFAIVALGASVALGQVSKVISDLNSIDSMTKQLTSKIKAFSGPVSGVAILNISRQIQSSIKDAISATSAAGTVSDSDQADVLKAAETLYPDIIASLDAFVAKQSDFDDANLGGVASNQLDSLSSSSSQLAQALAGKATGDFKTAANTLATNIASAFSAAKAGNAPQASPLPSIPSSSGGSTGGSSSAAASSSAAPTSAAGGSGGMSMSMPMGGSTPTPTPTPTATPTAPSPAGSATTGTYTGAANQLVSNVGGAVLLAAAAFAL